MSRTEFIHRATWSDGHVTETEVRNARPGQACFAGLTQSMLRRQDPGVTVVHLERTDGGEWHE